MRLPIHAGELLNQVTKARGRLEGQLGRRPTVPELAADLELEEEKVTEILRHAADILSLFEPLGEDGDLELGDTLEDRSGALTVRCRCCRLCYVGEVNKMLIALDEREREILQVALRTGPGPAPHPRRDREAFQSTRERIRQIEARAMSKLRHPSIDNAARELLTG